MDEPWQQIKPSSLTQPNSRPLAKQSTSTGWLAFTKITKSPRINLKLGKQHKLQLATKKSHNGVDLLGCFALWHLFSPVFPLKSGVTGLRISACLYHIRHTHGNTSAAFTSALQLKRNLRATAPIPEAQRHGMTCLDRRESPGGGPLWSPAAWDSLAVTLQREPMLPSLSLAAKLPGQLGRFSHSAQLSVNSGSQFKWGIERWWRREERVRQGGRRVASPVAPGQRGCWVSLEPTWSMSVKKRASKGRIIQLHYKATSETRVVSNALSSQSWGNLKCTLVKMAQLPQKTV